MSTTASAPVALAVPFLGLAGCARRVRRAVGFWVDFARQSSCSADVSSASGLDRGVGG